MINIDTKHVVWIFEAAGENFSQKVAELEMEVMRHEHFLKYHHGEALVRNNMASKTRAQRLEEARQSLEQYRNLTTFCREAKIKAVDKTAEEFAKAFKGMFKI